MINLLPPDIKTERQFGRRNRLLVTYSVLVLFIGFSSIGLMLFNLQIAKRDVELLHAERDEFIELAKVFDEEQQSYSTISGNLETVEKLYAKQVLFSELIPQIAELLPSGSVLNSLTLNEGRDSPLNLNIDIETQELAAVFQQNLVKSDLFEAADVINIVSKGDVGEDSTEQYRFSATVNVGFADTRNSRGAQQ